MKRKTTLLLWISCSKLFLALCYKTTACLSSVWRRNFKEKTWWAANSWFRLSFRVSKAILDSWLRCNRPGKILLASWRLPIRWAHLGSTRESRQEASLGIITPIKSWVKCRNLTLTVRTCTRKGIKRWSKTGTRTQSMGLSSMTQASNKGYLTVGKHASKSWLKAMNYKSWLRPSPVTLRGEGSLRTLSSTGGILR